MKQKTAGEIGKLILSFRYWLIQWYMHQADLEAFNKAVKLEKKIKREIKNYYMIDYEVAERLRALLHTALTFNPIVFRPGR